MTGGVLKNLVVVRAEQGVKARGWDPNEFRGGGGTVGCRLAEIDKGWGITHYQLCTLTKFRHGGYVVR